MDIGSDIVMQSLLSLLKRLNGRGARGSASNVSYSESDLIDSFDSLVALDQRLVHGKCVLLLALPAEEALHCLQSFIVAKHSNGLRPTEPAGNRATVSDKRKKN